MKSYRDVLYRNYSKNFGDLKSGAVDHSFSTFPLAYDLSNLNRGVAIADIGCGRGEWLRWLSHNGYQHLFGFDVSSGELSSIPGATSICGDALKTLDDPKWQNFFTLIHAKDFIEHLTKQEMIDFLTVAHSALKQGGSLWLSTFNAQGIFHSTTRYGDFTHENAFTPSSLSQALRSCGYRVDRIEGTHICPPTVKGAIRKLTYRLASIPAGLLLRARHGGQPDKSFSTFSVAPDLFAAATKIEL